VLEVTLWLGQAWWVEVRDGAVKECWLTCGRNGCMQGIMISVTYIWVMGEGVGRGKNRKGRKVGRGA